MSKITVDEFLLCVHISYTFTQVEFEHLFQCFQRDRSVDLYFSDISLIDQNDIFERTLYTLKNSKKKSFSKLKNFEVFIGELFSELV